MTSCLDLTRRAPVNSWRSNAAYGLLAAPLAMAALPLFVQLPAYYAAHAGVALADLGWVLFLARLIDMLQDPLLGHLVDHAGARRGRWMILSAALLAAAFAGLWLPPRQLFPAAQWLGVLLVLAYGAHSMLQIAHLAWATHLPQAGLPAVALREGAGLAGVILASVLPPYLLAAPEPQVAGRLAAYSLAFALLLALALACLLHAAPRTLNASGRSAADGAARAPGTPGHPGHPAHPEASATPASRPTQSWRGAWQTLAANHALRALLPAYLLNALSVAIPATLALFFIADRLQASALAGAFLACYFGAAACGLPLWTALARRWGALRSWRLGMMLSVAGFAAAGLLGPGDTAPYLLVCLAAGAALGADLALPPVLLAQALGRNPPAGAAFGVFTLLGKLALALSGLALPALAQLGYQPGDHAGAALSAMYAGLPCVLKLLALAALPRQTSQQPKERPA